MVQDLFKEEDNYLVRVDLSIKVLDEFKALIERDKDRKKRVSTSEFAWMYHMYNPKSPFSAEDESVRSDKILKSLSALENWKPDKLVKEAAEKYKELFVNTPDIKLLLSLIEGLNMSNNLVKILNKKIRDIISLDENGEGITQEDIKDAMGYLNSLIKIADDIPTVISKIKKLENDIKKDSNNDMRIKGGGEIGYFEDPE
tara:strand:- start:435 stop:1034 length:600 start_codon:yes stop_codon:yes gene_type:complete